MLNDSKENAQLFDGTQGGGVVYCNVTYHTFHSFKNFKNYKFKTSFPCEFLKFLIFKFNKLEFKKIFSSQD